MPSPKLAILGVLAALGVAGCGTIAVKPSADRSSGAPRSRGQVDDPRATKPDHVACLRANGLAVREVGTTDLVIADGVRVHFEPTPGSAQDDQIRNREQSAEVIGSALLVPGTASDAELSTIEHCIAAGVKG